ncbi:hypothetical protein GOV11_01865 [Candidatus Woesearchaeota archaeon]|nr:hypothetical protein [Candidatus Woesearchaeota archaeon]
MARRVRWEYIILAVLLVALFWVRMEISAGTESLSYDSYLVLRSVNSIHETGSHLAEDSLSVLSPARVRTPVFDYILAALTLITPAMYKILPNLFMVLLLIPVYFLARQITKSPAASLISVVLAGTGEFIFSSYLNTPSATPLAAILLLAIIAMLGDPAKYLEWIIALTLLLTFLHPLIFLVVLSLLVIILLLKLEGFGMDSRINELFFFTLLIAIWFYVLIYKNALFADGLRLIWQNLPVQYAASRFESVTLLSALYGMGVITFLFGILGAYHVLFESRMKASFGVVGASFAIGVAMLLRLVEFRIGMLLLTALLSILAGYGLLVSTRYLRKTKLPWAVYPFGIFVVFLFVFTALLPALSAANNQIMQAPSADDVTAFRALKSMVPQNAVVLTTVREAWAVQYFSQRRTLADADFLLVSNADELVSDTHAVYTGRFTTGVVDKSEKWEFSHILFSGDAARQYDRVGIQITDEVCLPSKSLSVRAKVYTVACRGVEK